MRELAPGTDRWGATVCVPREGRWTYQVRAWGDPVSTWRHHARIKIPAGIDTGLVLEEGACLYERAAAGVPKDEGDRGPLLVAVEALRDGTRPAAARLAAALTPEVDAVLARHPLREQVSASEELPLLVERERALYGSWYEFFPRSEGTAEQPHGTFRTAARRLPALAEMGFDVVYLPPIHPIGHTFRKGRNNSLSCGPDEVGVPWAIGSSAGGHDAVHPDLGTIDDFDAFVAQARALGLEIALDFALQCSPDHPWVDKHPEWFHHRPDGTIAYAENPPKKYQDIYPHRLRRRPGRPGHRDPAGAAALDGARRADLPRGQPAHQTRRLLGAGDRRHQQHRPGRDLPGRGLHPPGDDAHPRGRSASSSPTPTSPGATPNRNSPTTSPNCPGRPRATCGRTSSSTPPTSCTPTSSTAAAPPSRYGPSWPPPSPPPGASTAATNCARTPPCATAARSTSTPRSTNSAPATGIPRSGRDVPSRPCIARLNAIRRRSPALRQLRNLHFHHADNEAVIAYSKRAGANTVLVVANLDPHHTQEATVSLDMPQLGLDWHESVPVRDELTGETYHWGRTNYVRLEPGRAPAHVLTVLRPSTPQIGGSPTP